MVLILYTKRKEKFLRNQKIAKTPWSPYLQITLGTPFLIAKNKSYIQGVKKVTGRFVIFREKHLLKNVKC